MERTKFFEQLNREYDRLKAMFDGLTPAERLQPDVVGFWSVKDMLAHLIHWNRFPLQELDSALRGVPMVVDERGDDAINADAVAHYQAASFESVWADFEKSVGAVVSAIENLPDKELVQRLGDTIEGTFANNTYEHWAEHRVPIEAFFARLR